MILILSSADDVHADAMETVLDDRGVDHVRLDPALFPASASLSVGFTAAGLHLRTVRLAGRVLDLDDVSAVWVRRPNQPRPEPRFEGTPVGDFIVSETTEVTADLWELLEVTVVPAPRSVVRRAQYKMRQLQLAAQLGLELPPTLVTNDPDALLDFVGLHGDVITKQAALTSGCRTPDGSWAVRYTERLRPSDLVHLTSVASCPLVVQSYVPKELELRVTVVGSRVFAAAIHSQMARHTRDDWRRYDDSHVLIQPWELPQDVAAALVSLNERLGLLYSASDFVLTPDGRYVYLETNPSGQYLWVERTTGLPITEAIADVLGAEPARLEKVA